MSRKMIRATIPALYLFYWFGCPPVLEAIQLPAEAEREELWPGAWRFSWQATTAAGPAVVHGFYWKLGQEDLRVVATAGQGGVSGNEKVSRQAENEKAGGRRSLAAVNADFFTMRGSSAGSVHGLFVRDGELLSLGEGPVAAFLDQGALVIEEFSVVLEIETDDGTRVRIDHLNTLPEEGEWVLLTPSWGGPTYAAADGVEVRLKGDGLLRPTGRILLEVTDIRSGGAPSEPLAEGEFILAGRGPGKGGLREFRVGDRVSINSKASPGKPVAQAVGGLPIMIRAGEVQYFPGAKHEDFVPGPGDPNTRHPRTAIGSDGEHGVAIVVDGRAPGYSVGMTIPELGELMRALGCTEALNLDGGGSSTAWAKGRVLNRPSGTAERPVGNALVLVRLEGEEGGP